MPAPTSSLRPGRLGDRVVVLTVALLATAVSLSIGYRTKAVCAGPTFTDGRSAGFPQGPSGTVIPCYSDLMELWSSRGLGEHLFPYVHGGIGDGQLYGGVVEYPVGSGLLIWLGALGTHTDLEFLQHSAVILAPFAFGTTILLVYLVRWWALLWAATPPLVLYAFHNWELPVVFTTVAAAAIMACGARGLDGARRWPLVPTAVAASAVLAVGFSLKLYPGMFVVPLAIFVLTASRRRPGLDWAGAAWVAGSAVVTAAAIQLPFMIAGFDGWRAALDFQGLRRADVTTNSVWYWGVRHLFRVDADYHAFVDVASPLAVLIGFGVAIGLGWRVYRRAGVFPWLPVAGGMLAAFLLLHKVHSPQFALWMVPVFALLRVRWPVIVAYLTTNVVIDLAVFRILGMTAHDEATAPAWVTDVLQVGVWVQAVLLVWLLAALPLSRPRAPTAPRPAAAAAPA